MSPDRPAAAPATRPPLPLTVIHLIVFGGIACAAIEFAFPEWRQLFAVLRQPYAMGELPRSAPLIGSFLCGGLLGVLLFHVARRRTVRVALSVAILAAGALSLWPAPAAKHRSWGAVDKAILLTTQKVQKEMVGRLEERGEVPVDPAPWQAALAQAATTQVPATQRFHPLAYRLEPRPWESPLPGGLAPGTVVARVSPDGAAFALNAVGFSPEGKAAYLRDDRGELLTLRGLFNPNRAPEQVPVPNGARPPDGF